MNKAGKTKSLQRRLLMPLLVSLPLIMAVTGAVEFAFSSGELNHLMNSKAENLASFLQKVGATYLANYDASSLERFVETSRNDSDVVFAAFFDSKGRMLTKNSEEPKDLTNIRVYERAIKGADGTELGSVKVGYRKDAVAAVMRNNLITVTGGIFLSLLLVGFVVFGTTGTVVALVARVVEQLSKTGNELGNSADGIAMSSRSLSNSANEQGISVSKSMSALTQLESMIERTATNARKSSEVAGSSRDSVVQGKEVVDGMLKSIQAITSSHDQLNEQIRSNSQRLREISGIIARIGDRTKVINDIVFQTKLLSFNASVEAARAGEHGKGFAVVADEVGKLAQMSGAAAREIGDMLATSVKKVDLIILDSERQVNTLLDSAQQRLTEGTVMASRCDEVFNKIAGKSESAFEMANEIAKANNDQTKGVREIQDAMAELKRAMEQNADISSQQSTMAANLTAESAVLHKIMDELAGIVKGSATPVGPAVIPFPGNSARSDDQAA